MRSDDLFANTTTDTSLEALRVAPAIEAAAARTVHANATDAAEAARILRMLGIRGAA